MVKVEDLKRFCFQDIFIFVMYYVYGVPGSSLLIQSTDSMMSEVVGSCDGV